MSDIRASFENTVLGMVLRENQRLARCLEVGLSREVFTQPVAAKTWDAIVRRYDSQLGFDAAELAVTTPDLHSYVFKISEEAPRIESFEFHLQNLLNLFTAFKAARDLSSVTRSLLTFEGVGSLEPFADATYRVYQALNSGFTALPGNMPLSLANSNYIDDLEARMSGHRKSLETPLRCLNAALKGWSGGRLYYLAARTSVGKTTMAINFAHRVAEMGGSVLFFSNEMSESEVAGKLLSLRTGLVGSRLEGGATSEQLDLLMRHVRLTSRYNFHINTRAGRRIESIEGCVRSFKRERGLDFVVLDYVQQVGVGRGRFETKHQQISEVSQRLKDLAMELDIPVVALAQINRDTERGQEPRLPSLAHLKDSGSLEQDADAVLIIHRQPLGENMPIPEFQYYLSVAKNRHGGTGVFEIKADLARNKFED